MKFTSPVWSSARGAIAGTVYRASGPTGLLASARAAHPGSQSRFLLLWRGALARAQSEWRALSSHNRNLWDAWALSAGFDTGLQAFIHNRCWLRFYRSIGGSASNFTPLPPLDPGNWSLGPVTAIPNPPVAGRILVSYHNPGQYGARTLIRFAGPVARGKTTWRGSWWTRYHTLNGPNPGSTLNTSFTGFVPGARYIIRIDSFEHRQGTRRGTPWLTHCNASL